MKLKGYKNESWVTCVTTDQDAKDSIILAQSLKRVLTNRSVVVLVSVHVSAKLRTLLHREFDMVLILEEDANTANLEPKEFGKLAALLMMKSFEKCCYVSPTMMFLKNADEMFATHSASLFACTGDKSLPIFIFKPSIDAYSVITKALGSRNGTSVTNYIQNWFRYQLPIELMDEEKQMSPTTLGPEFNRTISKKRDGQASSNMSSVVEPFIVNFVDHPNKFEDADMKDLGLIDLHAIKIWNELYNNYRKEHAAIMNDAGLSIREPNNSIGYKKEPIAIVGMSCRYPSSKNLEEFWNLLFNGEDGTGNAPPYRWVREQCARNRPDCRKTNAGFLNVPIDEFDAKFFGISPKEVNFLDPQIRLLHELVWEGLEDAAIDPLKLRGSNGGIFMGSWTNDYKDILNHSGESEFYRTYMGNSIGAAAARISFLLGLTGPSIATESGCSSAMVAVHLACTSLLLGETNMALACGVNLLLHPFDKDEMPMVISPEGRCKTFDAKADGFARGEGCGVLVLKRLSDAIRDNDPIWALIRGTGISQEGISRSMGTPTAHCEALAMENALEDAQVDPAQIFYVETHGTGTVVGDPLEINAISKAYGPSTGRKEQLIIGSVKTNVGHTESCSGITGIMKVVLSMHHEIIPQHRNFETLNPAINLDSIPAIIPLKPFPWPKSEKTRLAGVSSFGITGTDAHAIIEEPPMRQKFIDLYNFGMERPLHIFKMCAKSDEALEDLSQRYQEHLKSLDDEQFPDFVHTANSGRADFNLRAILSAKNRDEALDLLSKREFHRKEVNSENESKICFLFTGQGSQYVGMAKSLFECSPIFRIHFEFCENILKTIYKINIREALWPKDETAKGNLSRTIYSQTSIFVVEYCLLKLWESWGITPDYVMGHSLGEFVAAVCAEILSVEDALMLVAERSRLIDQLPGGKMLVIKADKSTVERMMTKFGKTLDYAAINSSQQTVVAGDTEVVQKFAQFCSDKNLKSIILDASHAFHSKHMDPMLGEYLEIAKTVRQVNNCGDHSPKYISAVWGGLVAKEDVNAEYWVHHTRDKVQFLKASKAAVQLGCEIFIEVGPQPVLSALTMMNNDESNITCLPSLKRNESDWNVILGSLGKLYLSGKNIDWKGFDQFYDRKKIRLPHYPFQGKKHWPDMMAITGNAIHPLLGASIPNASSVKIFQNGLNLRCVEYVKDHTIGPIAVFPGAGYLEMTLAAGLATVECSTETMTKPSRPMKVENLKIFAPMALEESKTCQVQIVVDFNSDNINTKDWNDLTIKIFHRVDSKWLQHASASFIPLPSGEDIKSVINFDKHSLTTLIESPSNDEMIAQVYSKLASVGLKFGPTFQSLEKVWKDESGLGMLAKVKIPTSSETSESQQYILHPVVLDAMIQAIMIHKHSDTIKKRLYVPISIANFLWLANPEGKDLYIYTRSSEGSPNQAILVDEIGTVIASMSGVDLIETTVKAVESVLEQQTSVMPDLWEESWRAKPGPLQHQLPESVISENYFTKEFLDSMEMKHNVVRDEERILFDNLSELTFLWILNSFYECGWSPKVGQNFTTNEIIKELKINNPQCRQLANYFLEVLSDEGILERRDDNKLWHVKSNPPAREEVKNKLQQPLFTEELVKKFDTTRLLNRVGEDLPKCFRGELSGIQILFPEDTKKYPSASGFYVDYMRAFSLTQAVIDMAEKTLGTWAENVKENGKYNVKFLEVGAGTGSTTSYILPILEALNMEFEYTFTDISPAFFPPAEKRFAKHNMIYKKFNLEEDPLSQGFVPDYYDCVIASDVIHATKDICKSLQNIRKVVRTGGTLQVLEQIKKNRVITFVFGLMEGFWRFEDFRKDHCMVDSNGWIESLKNSGFDNTVVVPIFNNYHGHVTSWATDEIIAPSSPKFKDANNCNSIPTWLIFSNDGCKLTQFLQNQFAFVERDVVLVKSCTSDNSKFEMVSLEEFKIRSDEKSDYEKIVEMLKKRTNNVEGIIYLWGLDKTRRNQDEILQPYFHIVQTMLGFKQKVNPRLCAITQGVVPISDADLSHFHTSTLWGFTKTLKNEVTGLNCRCISIPHDVQCLSENEMKEIYYEVWSNDKEQQVALYNNSRHVARFQPAKVTLHDLPLPPGSNRFQLILPQTRAIADLTFGPMEPYTLEANEIEIQICAIALNFRDVLTVLKPSKDFEEFNAVGLDYSGQVKRIGSGVTKWKIGDYVFGVNQTKTLALPSHIKSNEEDVVRVPDRMTLCEAATLPAVYATTYLCLVDIAKVTKDDTVLIHTASGGVGLSAIQLLQNIGAKIIATCGSKRKQNYLRSLGIQHIFNSRNTDYSEQILKLTNGKGVDVVLNSLTSEGFKEATLRACAKGARFVEMSKLSIWEPEEVQKLRPDVKYTIVDLTASSKEEWRRLLNNLEKMLKENTINSISYVRFDAVHIREALQYLQKAKHVGKIVCVMPEFRMEDGVYKAFTPLFNDRSTYLVTGGLGGIGFECGKWMFRNGAKHIILASRSPPKPDIQKVIQQLNSEGANIIPVSLDVGNFEQCKALLDKIKAKEVLNLPPLRGIMHAAGILADGLIVNQTWPKLSSTFTSKICGTLNLHELTKGYNLEHFVCFSSIASLLGSPAQANHSAGNNFEDAFCYYRNSIGLCATTVNWGPWGETGVAVEVDLPGMKSLSNLQGLAALEYILKSQRLQTCVMNMESFVLFSKFSPQISVYLDDRIWKAGSSSGTSITIKSDEFWQNYDSQEDPSEKVQVVKNLLRDILRKILKLEENEPIEDDSNLQDMGVDSLMFIEIKNSVQALLGDRVTVNANALRDCNTVRLLSEQLIKLIEGDDTGKTQTPPTNEEVIELIREDSILPDHITAVGRTFKHVSQIRRILLTGVTGTLGPYILKELSELPQIEQIVCLIRPNKTMSPEERLSQVLAKRNLSQSVEMTKVSCVLGNVALPNLGLEDEDWSKLTENIDCVFHCAVKADHVENYKKSDSKSGVRAVNITGTKNILEFACTGEVKHTYMASSLLAVSGINDDGTFAERWSEIDEFDGVTKAAYPISKFVGDLLLKTAVLERNVPAKLFRYPIISGDSKTGQFILDHNHVMLRYLFIMKSGIMPSDPFPLNAIPVDLCASISVKIFFNEKLANQFEVYNVSHPSPDLDQEFAFLSEKMGHPVQLVEYKEFTKKLMESPDDSSFSLFKDFYNGEEQELGMVGLTESLKKWLEGVENFWRSKKIAAVYPEFFDGLDRCVEMLEKDFMYAKKEGWLEKFGLGKTCSFD